MDPFRFPGQVELVNIQDWYQLQGPGRLMIRWNRPDVAYGESELVDIELWGYYEDDTGPHWDLLQVKFVFILLLPTLMLLLTLFILRY